MPKLVQLFPNQCSYDAQIGVVITNTNLGNNQPYYHNCDKSTHYYHRSDNRAKYGDTCHNYVNNTNYHHNQYNITNYDNIDHNCHRVKQRMLIDPIYDSNANYDKIAY